MGIFRKKKRINFRTFTLSQSIRLKTQESDFSYKTESKILALIYEHLKYNDCSQQYLGNGINMTVARGLFNQYVNNAANAIHDNTIRRDILEGFVSIVSRTYFWMEVTKSIDILTNPAHITDGHRRGVILELLMGLRDSLLVRIRCEMALVAYYVIPVSGVAFSRIPIGERERFISNMFDTVKENISHHGVTRNPRMTSHYMTGVNPLRPQEGVQPVSNEHYRIKIDNYQRQLTSRVAAHPNNPINWTNARTGAVGSSRDARLMQAVNANALDPEQDRRRLKMHKDMGLLFEHMEKIRDLSPGETVTVYEHEDSYYTEEECKEENIVIKGKPIVLEHMTEEVFRNKCDALKAQFKSSFPNAQMFVYQY